jgi:hypothetical protein
LDFKDAPLMTIAIAIFCVVKVKNIGEKIYIFKFFAEFPLAVAFFKGPN